MKIRTAEVWHGQDGYKLQVVDVPLWVLVVRRILYGLHYPVFHNPLGRRLEEGAIDWLWRVGWKRDPDYKAHPDQYNPWIHSLGRGFYQTAAYMSCDIFGYRRERRIGQLPVTDEWMAEHMPDERVEPELELSRSSDPSVSRDAARWTPEAADDHADVQ